MARKKIESLENEVEIGSAEMEQPPSDVPTVEIPQPAAPVSVQDDEPQAPTISSIPFEPASSQPASSPTPQYSPAPPSPQPAPSRPYTGKGKPDGVILTAIYHFIIGLPFIMVSLILLLIPVPAILLTVRDTLPLTLALIAMALTILFTALCGIIPIVTGFGLLRMRNWARWLAITIALLSLPLFPLGTLTGALILVYLLSDSGRQSFIG